ncbi:hypothetical protein ACFUTX_16450 [Microbacterium sp. NPDC057407]|uniref:hypothetical protein n=1 Tax=Microbacterium sp. NPDC057407 TaxID=3346120 RepID=UPI00366C51C7
MRTSLAMAMLGATAVALSACVPYVIPSEGPIALQPPQSGGMDAALIGGTLHIDDDCAWVETDGEDYVPVFPMDVARLEAGELVYGARYRDGDRINFTGGESGEQGPDWYIPSGCPDLKLWNASGPPQA